MTALAPAAQETKTAPASFYEIIGSNDAFWRVTAPARAVGGKTFLVPERREDDMDSSRFMQPNDTDVFPWRFLVDKNDPSYFEIEYPEHEGAAIWVRPDSSRSIHALAMKHKLGHRIIGEVDDNYTGKRKNTVFMRARNWTAYHREQHLACLASMDAITFSTEALRDTYFQAFGRFLDMPAWEIPEMYVCRNHVPDDAWPDVVEHDGPVRVGWMGSPSHMWDVNIAWNAMLHASRLGCETWMIGYDPCNPWGEIPPDELTVESERAIDKWKQVGFKHIGWVKPDEFKRFSLPLDIGLCPVIKSDFTDGKSDCKFWEYSIAGAATIASDTVVYNKTIIHGETGLLVRTEGEMAAAVGLLARDENLRLRLVNNARQYIAENRGTAQLREEWMAAING